MGSEISASFLVEEYCKDNEENPRALGKLAQRKLYINDTVQVIL